MATYDNVGLPIVPSPPPPPSGPVVPGSSVFDNVGNLYVTQTTAPGPPTNVVAMAGDTTAIISWVPPDNHGSGITSYTITGAGSLFVTSNSIVTVRGLTNGVSYTFTVVANGISGLSSTPVVSNTVIPAVVVLPPDPTPPPGPTPVVPIVVAPKPVTTSISIGDQSGPQNTELTSIYDRTLTRNLWDPSSMSFSCNGANPESTLLFNGISDVIWRRNGKALFRGRMTVRGFDRNPDTLTISCTVDDYRHLLDRRMIVAAPFNSGTPPAAQTGILKFGINTKLEDIVWGLINHAQIQSGGNMGLTKGLFPQTGVIVPSAAQIAAAATATTLLKTLTTKLAAVDAAKAALQNAQGLPTDTAAHKTAAQTAQTNAVSSILTANNTLVSFLMSSMDATTTADQRTVANTMSGLVQALANAQNNDITVNFSTTSSAAQKSAADAAVTTADNNASTAVSYVTSMVQTQANVTIALSAVAAFADGSSIWASLSTLIKGTPGFDLDIDENKKVSIYYPQRGSDKGAALDFGGTVASYSRSDLMDTFANAVRQSGSDPSFTTTLTAPDITTRPEGRWDMAVSDSSLLTKAAVANAAEFSYQSAVNLIPSYSLVMALGAWGGPDHIDVGDLINVRIKDGPLDVNDKLRVYSISIVLDQNDVETVTVVVGRPRSTPQHIWKWSTDKLRFLDKH